MSVYVSERASIEVLRRKYPTVPQKTLATRISRRDFEGADAELAKTAALRPFLSIYSVIRRFDAKLREKTAAAIAGNALPGRSF